MTTSRRAATRSVLHSGPFDAALRAALSDSGLTLERVRDRLRRKGVSVSLSTLSHWQTGRSRPERAVSLQAIREIERMAGLAPGALISLLGPQRPRGKWSHPGAQALLASVGQSLSEDMVATLSPLIERSAGVLATRVVDEVLTIDSRGCLRSIRTRLVVEAVCGFPDRYTAVYMSRDGSSSGVLGMRALTGCRVGRVRRHPSSPIVAAEMLLGAPLLPGQHHVLEYEVVDRGRTTRPRYARFIPKGTSSAVITALFDRYRVPARCFGRVGEEEPRELSLSADLATHLITAGMPGGQLEVSWEWPEQPSLPPEPAR